MKWLALFKVVVDIINSLVQGYKERKLLEAGAALQTQKEVEEKNAIEETIRAAKSDLSDADVDELLKHPRYRSRQLELFDNATSVSHGYDLPDER